VSLKQRLAQVPGFEQFIEMLDEWESEDPDGGIVDSVWKLLRLGSPLLVIYNLLQPDNPIVIEDANANDKKKSKMAIYKFVEAVKRDLDVVDIFTISDLTQDDTTGFVKVREPPPLAPFTHRLVHVLPLQSPPLGGPARAPSLLTNF
jgi:cell division control protein 24